MRRFLLVVGVAASLVVIGAAVAATINGTKGNDTIRGTARADVLNGRGGSDTISGLAGNDRISGGPGNDRISGGGGKDIVSCGAGIDRVQADRLDVVAKDCEVVTRAAVSTPPTPQTPPTLPPVRVALRAAGPPEVMFDWTNDRCEDADIPDLPARAFRDANGNVQLLASHYVTRVSVGPDLDHLTHRCRVVHGSQSNPDPSVFADREWIASTYTTDGRTVYALLHDEYHGYEHPGQCTVGWPAAFSSCWYNAITLAVSTDSGETYVDQPQPRLVASEPIRYVPDVGPIGVFTPSNIVRNPADNYYYALVYVGWIWPRNGACLIRTQNLADPASWRAWSGGKSFNTSFIDPYRSKDLPSAHSCRTLENLGPKQTPQPGSITFSSVAQQWLWVGETVGGAHFSLSPDLINWTTPELFFPAQETWNYKCGDSDPYQYPSLIDPASTSRNFETVGDTAYLYYTLHHYSNCGQTLDRDLVRVPITITR